MGGDCENGWAVCNKIISVYAVVLQFVQVQCR